MEISRHWRLNGQRYGLEGAVCVACGKAFFSPRPVCDECHAPVALPYDFKRSNGKLVHVERPIPVEAR